ncbi:MAG: type II toxin-antitoxin system HicB family antitoxin [Hyphomicrobiales bacterium]
MPKNTGRRERTLTYFVGIVDGEGEAWGVRFPDCPGAYGGGPTIEAAISDATTALAAWSEATLKDGGPLPAPRSLAEIAADARSMPNAELGEIAVLVPLLLDKGKPTKATLSIDAGYGGERRVAAMVARGIGGPDFGIGATQMIEVKRPLTSAEKAERDLKTCIESISLVLREQADPNLSAEKRTANKIAIRSYLALGKEILAKMESELSN